MSASASTPKSSTIRARLIPDVTYAAHPDLKDNVSWKTTAKGGDLVLNKSMRKLPAIIKLVARISRERFNFASLGTYETAYTYNLGRDKPTTAAECSKAKFQFSVVPVEEHADLAKDFATAVSTMDAIQLAALTENDPAPPKYFIEKEGDTLVFRINYPLWQVKLYNATNSTVADDTLNKEDLQIKIEGMRRSSFTAGYQYPDHLRDGFKYMQGTHDIVLPNIIDANGKAFQPAFYRARLPDSIVELHFSLQHMRIRDKGAVKDSVMSAKLVKMLLVDANALKPAKSLTLLQHLLPTTTKAAASGSANPGSPAKAGPSGPAKRKTPPPPATDAITSANGDKRRKLGSPSTSPSPDPSPDREPEAHQEELEQGKTRSTSPQGSEHDASLTEEVDEEKGLEADD